jgi:hypothetical protein
MRMHEQILQPDAVPAAEGGVGVEPDRKTRRLALPFGDVAEDARVRPEDRLGDLGLRRDDVIGQSLVSGERLDEIEDEPGLVGPGGTDD